MVRFSGNYSSIKDMERLDVVIVEGWTEQLPRFMTTVRRYYQILVYDTTFNFEFPNIGTISAPY